MFSPVRMSPLILRETLYELSRLKRDSLNVEFWFYDDNDDFQSSALLKGFSGRPDTPALVLDKLDLADMKYEREERRHLWNAQLVDRIITIKNAALARFVQSKHDHIFMVDADLCLHPQTLVHLVALDLPIVAEVWWTRKPGDDFCTSNVSFQPYGRHSAEMTVRLRQPGVYQVGTLAGCTLIRRDAVVRGASYSRIRNLDVDGEDKPFSVRAVCLGLDLFGDTTYPAFHVWHEALLPDVLAWRKSGYSYDYLKEWLDEEWENRVWKSNIKRKPSRLHLVKKLVKAVIKGEL